MGADFAAILSHGLSAAEICALPETLTQRESLSDAYRQLEAALCGRLQRRLLGIAMPRWKLSPRGISPEKLADAWREEWPCEIGAPCLTVGFGRRSCVINGMMKWAYFLTDDAVRHATRRACFELSGELKASPEQSAAIYISDWGRESEALEFVSRGCEFAEIRSWLQGRLGPPSPTIEHIYRDLGSGVYETVGYYIDEFSDFIVQQPAPEC